LVHLSGAIYSGGSAVASKYAMQQRWKLGRMTLQLQEANLQIAQQAEASTALAVAQERNQLAREIHDSVGHSLTVVGAQLDAAAAMLGQAPECALEALRKARRSNQDGLVEIRRSVTAMRASPLDHRSLPEAITALVDAMQQPHLKVILKLTGTPQALPPLVELTLYRCAQEGLTNACRHANATEVCVHLNFEISAHASVTVSDNGTAFAKVSREGVGLSGLRERAILLNGAFTIGHSPSGGCLIQMALPS
jgi:signal transduction histidine kinase